MGLGFDNDELLIENNRFYLITRPLDDFIVQHGGHVAPKVPTTRWTPYSVEWLLKDGYLYLTRFSQGSIKNHFNFDVPIQLMPLWIEEPGVCIKADWFTGFIPIYTKYILLGKPAYHINSLPLDEFEYLYVIKRGKHINTIKNLHFFDLNYELYLTTSRMGKIKKMQLPQTREEHKK